MELLKLIKNRISTEWKKTFNDNVDILNGITSDQNQKIDVVDKRIDNLVLHSGGDSPNEVVDARVNNEGKTYETLESRLLAAENKNDENVSDLCLAQSNQKKQIAQLNEVIRLLYNSNGSSISLYVSDETGSDETGDGTEAKPFKTIQTAVNQIPFINSSSTTIFIDAGVYLEDVKISNVIAPKISFRSIQQPISSTEGIGDSELPVKVRSIWASNCTSQFWLYGIQFVDQIKTASIKYKYAVAITDSGSMTVEKCAFRENTKSLTDHRTVQTSGNSNLHFMKSDIRNQNIAFYADTGSELRVGGNNSGAGNNVVACAENSTLRTNNNVAGTTLNQTIGSGLIIAKGTVL